MFSVLEAILDGLGGVRTLLSILEVIYDDDPLGLYNAE